MSRSLLAFVLVLFVCPSSHANDDSRIGKLELEVELLKQRQDALEALLRRSGHKEGTIGEKEKSQTLANWRKLRPGMRPAEVESILGAPGKLDGGNVAHWYYSNGGRVIFMSDELFQWHEPR